MQHNSKRQQSRVRLFESGLQFHANGDKTLQNKYIAGLIYGGKQSESWCNNNDAIVSWNFWKTILNIVTEFYNHSFIKSNYS